MYRHNGCWVFDDENFGLVAEAFVLGISEILTDMIVKKFGENLYDKGCYVTFAGRDFPQYDGMITRDKNPDGTWNEDMGGNWYHHEESGITGWLCPALFHYFEGAPTSIYAKFDKID